MAYRLLPNAPDVELTVLRREHVAAAARVVLHAHCPDEVVLREAVTILSDGYGTVYAMLQGGLAGNLRAQAAGGGTFRLFRDEALMADSLTASDVLDVFITASGLQWGPSDEEQAEHKRRLLAHMEMMREIEAVIVPLLVARDYPGLEGLGAGEGLSAAEIERQVVATGRTLTIGTGGGVRRGVTCRSRGRPGLTVEFDVCSEEGACRDVTIRFTIRGTGVLRRIAIERIERIQSSVR